VVLGIVDSAELPRCNTMNGLGGFEFALVRAYPQPLPKRRGERKSGRDIVACVANLDSNVKVPVNVLALQWVLRRASSEPVPVNWLCKPIKSVHLEFRFVG
jgi:hypothetical protein